MIKRFGIQRYLAIGLMAAPGSSFAAAWTMDLGHGQAILTATASRATEAFDTSRSLSKTSRYQKIDVQALMEYGLTNRLTLILSPGLQHVEIGAGASSRTGNPDYVEAGARYRIAEGDDWVLSGQTTMRWAGRSGSTANATPVDDTGNEIDVRGLFGYGFSFAHRPSFIDVQVGHRFRSGPEPDEVHADVTFGIRPSPKWLLLAQSFNVVSEGAGRPGFPSYDYLKFQPSVVYQLTGRVALQLGGFTTYTGRHSIQENGVVLGAWYKF